MKKPLPLRVLPVDRETFPSFLARLAAVNGATATEFAADMDFSRKKIIYLDEDATRDLADLGALDTERLDELVSWTGETIGNVRMTFRGEVFVSRALRNPRVRGCPICLREDLEAHDGPPAEAMAMRGDWQLREVSICVRHRHPLVELWEVSRPTLRFDIGERLSEVEGKIRVGSLEIDRVEPSAYDLWLDRRLATGDDDTWLGDHTLYAATIFCRLLGTELLRLEAQPEMDGASRARAAQAAGFNVASLGEGAIRGALNELTNLATGKNDEPAKAFGELFKQLSRAYASEDAFQPFCDLLRACILDS